MRRLAERRNPMTRLDRVLKLLEEYDKFALAQLVRDAKPLEVKDFDILIRLRKEKEQLTQELIEHGCRRKN
jgi:hypothetical protein